MSLTNTSPAKHKRKNALRSTSRGPLRKLILGKLKVFFQGLKTAFQTDKSFAFVGLISLVVLSIAFILQAWLDVLIILIVTGMLVTTELLNTAIEKLCDVVQPEFDPRIGQIKDIAAAATGIMFVVWLSTLIIEVLRIWP